MSDQGWAGFLGEHHQEESPAEQASRLARQQAERADRAELAAEAGRRAQLEEERDRRQVAYHTLGIAGRSQAELFADAAKMGDEDGEYAEALKTIERISRRRQLRAEAARFQAEQVAAVASRSQAPDDLLRDAKKALAAARVEAMLAAPRPGPAERRPFASRGAGLAVRSEHCTWCTEFAVSDEMSYLLHSDPERNVPVTPPGTVPAAEQARQVRAEQARTGHAEHAERRAEVDRLLAKGFSLEAAELAQVPYGAEIVR